MLEMSGLRSEDVTCTGFAGYGLLDRYAARPAEDVPGVERIVDPSAPRAPWSPISTAQDRVRDQAHRRRVLARSSTSSSWRAGRSRPGRRAERAIRRGDQRVDPPRASSAASRRWGRRSRPTASAFASWEWCPTCRSLRVVAVLPTSGCRSAPLKSSSYKERVHGRFPWRSSLARSRADFPAIKSELASPAARGRAPSAGSRRGTRSLQGGAGTLFEAVCQQLLARRPEHRRSRAAGTACCC